jgi:hypothetical protein
MVSHNNLGIRQLLISGNAEPTPYMNPPHAMMPTAVFVISTPKWFIEGTIPEIAVDSSKDLSPLFVHVCTNQRGGRRGEWEVKYAHTSRQHLRTLRVHHVDVICARRAQHQVDAEAVEEEAEEVEGEAQGTGDEVSYEATEDDG